MVKLRKNKTFIKKRLDKNKNKKNTTKKRLKGGTRETTLIKLQKIQEIKPTPRIKIEINKKDDPAKKPFFLMLDHLDNKSLIGTPIPNIIETSDYIFDDSVENAVKIIVSEHKSVRLKLVHTYTIKFDKNKKTINSVTIELELIFNPSSNNIKYIKELSTDEYEIKIYYLQEITEEFVEELSNKSKLLKEKNVNEDLQKIILSYLGNKDWVNII